MKRENFLFLLALLGTVVILATACRDSSVDTARAADLEAEEHADDADRTDDAMGDMDRAHVEAPDDFVSLTNPFSGDADATAAGVVIYKNNCATCHGAEGNGDGPVAKGLDPKPAVLADGMMMNTLSDGYLFWRVSKGGAMEPFNSAMPAWETGLSEEERWQVINYVRTLAGSDD